MGRQGIDVTWIDHHKTVIEAVKDYNVKGKRRIGTAACELTWEYLFDDIETPDVVELLSAYDVWDHDRFEWSDVMAFQYGMRGYCGLDVDMAAKVMDGDHDFIYDMIRNGRFFRCSFYTTKKEVDVSALARKANPGGGGHKAAAGFQLSVEDMMGFLKERRM